MRRLLLALLLASTSWAAIAYVAGTTASLTVAPGRSGNGTFDIIVPAGCAAGQTAIAICYSDSGTIAGSVDWTQATGSPWGLGALPRLALFYKVLTAALDTCVITIGGTAAGSASAGAVAVYSGVDPTTPVEVIGSGSIGTGTPMTALSINMGSANSWALGLCGRGDNEACANESIGGIVATERWDCGTNEGDDAMVNLYDRAISLAASGAGTSATSATDPWVSVLIALKPYVSAIDTKAFFMLFP